MAAKAINLIVSFIITVPSVTFAAHKKLITAYKEAVYFNANITGKDKDRNYFNDITLNLLSDKVLKAELKRLRANSLSLSALNIYGIR